MKTEIIAVANQKGGVGKTTTAVNLAAALAHIGHEVLMIDMDPQGNATSSFGFDKRTINETVYQVMTQSVSVEKTIRPTSLEYLDIICSNANLIGAEVELVSAFARESRLKHALHAVEKMYRFVIIDCPPSLGLLTINAMTAAQKVIIPMQCEYFALEGLANFIETLNKIKLALNPNLDVEGVVMTMFDPRTSLGQQVKGEVEKFFRGSFFQTTIPRNIRLAEAPSFGQSIFQYDPSSRGAEAYLNLAQELLSRRGHVNTAPGATPAAAEPFAAEMA